MNKIQRKVLEDVARCTPKDHSSICGLAYPPYPGMSWDCAPKQLGQLCDMGYVEAIIPHNTVHKDRACITEKGKFALLDEFLKKEQP